MNVPSGYLAIKRIELAGQALAGAALEVERAYQQGGTIAQECAAERAHRLAEHAAMLADMALVALGLEPGE